MTIDQLLRIVNNVIQFTSTARQSALFFKPNFDLKGRAPCPIQP